MTLKMEIANKCREIRREGRISLKDWAYQLGLRQEHIKDFETGRAEIPTLVLVEYANLKKENERRKNGYRKKKKIQ